MNIKNVRTVLKNSRVASGTLCLLTTKTKRNLLQSLTKRLIESQSTVLKANEEDLVNAEKQNLPTHLVERLKLSKDKIKMMADQIIAVSEQDDLVGYIDYECCLDKNLTLVRRKIPMGVIAMIFESRPDAVTQIFSLCFFSGNTVILKGGREAQRTITALVDVISQCLRESKLPIESIAQLNDRDEVAALLNEDDLVDLVIPRGGRDLVTYVQKNTRIPVLGHADGICHLYIDTDADWDMALKIAFDAKTQAPSTCNAIETLILHVDIAEPVLLMLDEVLKDVTLMGDSKAKAILPRLAAAGEPAWDVEYGALKLNVKIVNSIEEALQHIDVFGSKHTDVIVTENPAAAQKFFDSVDTGSVGWNASTRFADGYRFGLGAEVGISTSKIHARGPVGIEGLLTTRYEFVGQGHVVADYSGPHAKKFLHKPRKVSKL